MTHERIARLPADDWRRNSPDYREPRLSRSLRLVELLRIAGRHYGHTPGEVAVAWVLRNPAITGAIVGARRPGQFREIVGAAESRLSRTEAGTIEMFFAGEAA
jgi:aryl-alcohol dehydrogenase-like predicted oxidoreductase